MDKRARLLARRIERQRQSLRAQLRLLTVSRASVSDVLNGRERAGGDPEDAPEHGQQTLLKEQAMRAYERLTSQVKTLDRAWESLQRGTYGICQQCATKPATTRDQLWPRRVRCQLG